MSETNVQLFPGVFRSTVGGANPGFFLHSDGRVGIGNTAPATRPLWSSDDNDRNKLNVSGHTHIDGNLNVNGFVYGDGSTLSGVAAVVGGYWDLDQANNNIKYDVGNVGIGGAAGTNRLKVHGTVEATSYIVSTGHIYCGNTLYVGGSTSRGLRSITGDYGTVQTTGGGGAGWEGYSIDGRYVFMSDHANSNSSCGIYNDMDNEWMIQCWRNSGVDLFHNNSLRLYTDSTSQVPGGGFRIYGSEAAYNPYGPDHDYWTNGGQIQGDVGHKDFGLYVNQWVRAPGYIAFSDRRIKKDFVELDDTLALNTLRKLKPTTYRYIDKTRNAKNRVIGFIAQEVAEVLPDAVSLQNNLIPNIQCEASVKKVGENEFELTLKEPHVVTEGTKLELRLPDTEHIEANVQSVTNDTTFTIIPDKHYHLKDDLDRIWVYGEEIPDFHHLDKNAIFTVATAALQEVDRRQVAHDERIAALETRNAELEASLQNVLARLETLEAARV